MPTTSCLMPLLKKKKTSASQVLFLKDSLRKTTRYINLLCSTQSVEELCGKDSGHCLPIVNCGSNDSSSTLHVPECWQDLAKSWIAIIFKNKQWNTHLLQVYCVLRASAKLKILIEIEIDCTLVVFAFDISKFSQQDNSFFKINI